MTSTPYLTGVEADGTPFVLSFTKLTKPFYALVFEGPSIDISPSERADFHIVPYKALDGRHEGTFIYLRAGDPEKAGKLMTEVLCNAQPVKTDPEALLREFNIAKGAYA